MNKTFYRIFVQRTVVCYGSHYRGSLSIEAFQNAANSRVEHFK